MTCSACKQHRENIKAAIKAGSVKKAAVATVDAARAFGENAGRRLIPPKRTK